MGATEWDEQDIPRRNSETSATIYYVHNKQVYIRSHIKKISTLPYTYTG